MKEAFLIVSVLGVFIGGYFLMDRLDGFLRENRKAIESESEAQEPACIVLTEEASDEEIAAEIRTFRMRHPAAKIVLYDAVGGKK